MRVYYSPEKDLTATLSIGRFEIERRVPLETIVESFKYDSGSLGLSNKRPRVNLNLKNPDNDLAYPEYFKGLPFILNGSATKEVYEALKKGTEIQFEGNLLVYRSWNLFLPIPLFGVKTGVLEGSLIVDGRKYHIRSVHQATGPFSIGGWSPVDLSY